MCPPPQKKRGGIKMDRNACRMSIIHRKIKTVLSVTKLPPSCEWTSNGVSGTTVDSIVDIKWYIILHLWTTSRNSCLSWYSYWRAHTEEWCRKPVLGVWLEGTQTTSIAFRHLPPRKDVVNQCLEFDWRADVQLFFDTVPCGQATNLHCN